MNLYQLSEPNQISEVILGIDLGTTNSLVTIASAKGVELISDINSSHLIPSVVSYDKNEILVGTLALKSINPHYSVKRIIGEISTQLSATQLSNFTSYPIEYKEAIQDSAYILQYLKKLAENHINQEITQIVLTVPAHFNEHARNATRQAAEMAGLNVIRLLNEPTAAAVAYNLDQKIHGNFLIYDMGGGTFDVSILKTNNDFLKVIATAGDNKLGGDDFDEVLASYLFNIDNSLLKREQLFFAKKIKEYLSNNEAWSYDHNFQDINEDFDINNPNLTTKIQNDLKIKNIIRSEADELWVSLVNKSLKIVASTLTDSKIDIDKIDEIIMVGGSSRLPLIQQSIKKMFSKKPLISINPDEVVAIGAGIQARALLGYSDHLLLDVVPMSLSLETIGNEVEVIISKNTPIPAIIGKMFTTSLHGQTKFKIQIFQGEGKTIDECTSLGVFELDGITPMPAGEARLEVTFMVDANGLFNVNAIERISNVGKEMDVRRIS